MKRMTIEFSSKMSGLIQTLIGFGDAKTFSEVVRNSVGLYCLAKNEERAGNKIAIVDSNGKMVKEIYLGI